VPVVNENDTVATEEIRFGDNDRLAALVAHLVRADALVLLSDVDGLYDGDPRQPGSRLVPEVRSAGDLDGVVVGGTGSAGLGSGGMTEQGRRRRLATRAGVPVLLTATTQVAGALRGEGGTFSPRPGAALRDGCCGWPTPARRAAG
jgi:glutamate 5-kinase